MFVGDNIVANFGAVFVGSERPSSASINWGDGTTTPLPADAISSSHTYQSTGTYQVQVNYVEDGIDLFVEYRRCPGHRGSRILVDRRALHNPGW